MFAKRLRELCESGGLIITKTVDERSPVYGAARASHRKGLLSAAKEALYQARLNHSTNHSLERLLEEQG